MENTILETKSLGSLIKERMKVLHIQTARDLARLVGISPSYANELINDRAANNRSGQRHHSADVLVRLAKALQVDIEDVLHAAGLIDRSEKTRQEMHDIMAGVQVCFSDTKLPEEEKEDIIAMIKTIVAGKLAERAKIKFDI